MLRSENFHAVCNSGLQIFCSLLHADCNVDCVWRIISWGRGCPLLREHAAFNFLAVCSAVCRTCAISVRAVCTALCMRRVQPPPGGDTPKFSLGTLWRRASLARAPKPPLFDTVCLKGGKEFSAIKSIFGIRLAACRRGGQECFKAQQMSSQGIDFRIA